MNASYPVGWWYYFDTTTQTRYATDLTGTDCRVDASWAIFWDWKFIDKNWNFVTWLTYPAQYTIQDIENWL